MYDNAENKKRNSVNLKIDEGGVMAEVNDKDKKQLGIAFGKKFSNNNSLSSNIHQLIGLANKFKR